MNKDSENRKSGVNIIKHLHYRCNLKPIRIAKGMSQADLAREIGKTSQFLNMIEKEHYYPILETRIKIAQALGCDTSAIWILEVEDENS